MSIRKVPTSTNQPTTAKEHANMKTLRKFLSLVLSFSIAAYALPGFAYTYTVPSETDTVKVELTDEAMNQAVGAGAVDATLADVRTGDSVAKAVIANRSILFCDYSLSVIDSNGNVIATLASGSLAPDTATVASGAIQSGQAFFQAKITSPGVPGFMSIDSAARSY
jgi:hypothetical protein